MQRAVPILLFFLSGCAALIYELVWFHLLRLVVGASSVSVAALLASFMGGMGLGSALAPRLISARRHPLRVYAAFELGIGAAGLLLPFVLPFIQIGYTAIAGSGYAGVLLRALVGASVLLVPTMLMGATLPVMARWTETTRPGASTVGVLYTANIAGGVFGTLWASFHLLRVYDTLVATGVAVGLNVSAAAIAWWLAARAPSPIAVEHGDAEPAGALDERLEGVTGPPRAYVPRVYVVAALSGMTALGAEVVWTRQLSLLFGANVYTFSLILAVYLLGLGAGSLAGSALARRTAAPATALGWCQVLLVLAVALGARAIVEWLPLWQPTSLFLANVRSSPMLTAAYDALRCAVALFPATFLWGASFPLALASVCTSERTRAYAPTSAASARTSERSERTHLRAQASVRTSTFSGSVAAVNAINTAGSLAGALVFTLIAVPALGSQRAQQALVLLAGLSAALVLRPAAAAIALVIAVPLATLIVPAVPGRLIAYGRSVNSWASIEEFLYLEEGVTASIAVTQSTSGLKQFHIAGKVEASNLDIDMRLERMLGHIPALAHRRPRSVLVVGVGAGVTAGTFTVHPGIERIVICEIEPAVPASARVHFAEENHRVLDDPRTTLVFDDARHFLQTTRETFDIITSDPIHPWVRGAATLYSLEYLELARRRLNPGGVFTQWVPLYETDVASVKSEIATFAQVFPETTLWNSDFMEEGYDLVVMGRAGGAPIDIDAVQQRIDASAPLRRSLESVKLSSAAQLAATYAGRGTDLAPWLQGAEINRERHLRLQYLAGLALNVDERYRIFSSILKYRAYPADLFSASPATEGQLRTWIKPVVDGG